MVVAIPMERSHGDNRRGHEQRDKHQTRHEWGWGGRVRQWAWQGGARATVAAGDGTTTAASVSARAGQWPRRVRWCGGGEARTMMRKDRASSAREGEKALKIKATLGVVTLKSVISPTTVLTAVGDKLYIRRFPRRPSKITWSCDVCRSPVVES